MGGSVRDQLANFSLLSLFLLPFQNPFFLSTLLRSFYSNGLLRFDFQCNRWQWSLEGMWRSQICEDVVDVLLVQMRALPPEAQRVLQMSACVGNTFTLHALHMVTQMHVQTLVQCVLQLEQSGLLTCTAHAHDLVLLAEGQPVTKHLETPPPDASDLEHPDASVARNVEATPDTMHHNRHDSTDRSTEHLPPALSESPSASMVSASPAVVPLSSPSLVNIVIKFAHDKVQTAAYRLIPPEQLGLVHCTIAQQLLSHLTPDECEEYAIDITAHIEHGLGFIEMETPSGASSETVSEAVGSSSSTDNALLATEAIQSPSAILDSLSSTALPALVRELTRRCWSNLLGRSETLDQIIDLELLASRQAMAASAYESAIRFVEAALRLVQWKIGENTVPSTGADPEDAAGDGVRRSSKGSHLTVETGLSTTGVTTWQPQNEPTRSRITVSEACWQDSYATCLRCYQNLAQCYFLSSEYVATQQTIEYILSRVTDITDRGTVFDLHIQSLNQQSLMQMAVDVGLDHLRELGVELLPELSPELRAWIYAFPDVNDESTFHRHPVFSCEQHTNPVVMLLLSSLCSSLFFINSPKFYNNIITMLDQTVRCGATPETAYAMTCFGLLRWSLDTELALHYALSRSAHMLLNNYGEAGKLIRVRANTSVLGTSYPFKLKMRDVTRLLEEGFEEAVTLGEMEWAGYLAMYFADALVSCGISFAQTIAKQRMTGQQMAKRKHPIAAEYIRIHTAYQETLLGITSPDVFFSRNVAHYARYVKQLTACTDRGIIRYLEQQYEQATAEFDAAALVVDASPGLIGNHNYQQFRLLALLAACSVGSMPIVSTLDLPAGVSPSMTPVLPADYDPEVTMRTLGLVDKLLVRLRAWADKSAAPCNFRHRLACVLAERQRVCILSHLSDIATLPDCLSLYDQAVELALANGFPFDAAVAAERAASFYAELGRGMVARMYRQKAFDAYTAAGVVLKLRQMAVQYPQLNFDVNGAIVTISSAAALAHRNLQHPSSHLHQSDRHTQLLHSQFPHSPTTSDGESALVGGSVHTSSGSSAAMMSHSHSTLSIASQNTTSSTSSSSSSHSCSELKDQFAPISNFPPSVGGMTATTTYSQDGSTPLQTPASGIASGFSALPSVQASPGMPMFSPPISQSGLASNVSSSNGSGAYVHLSPLQSTEQNAKSNSFDGLSVLKATASFATETDTRKLLKRLMAIVLETAGATRGCFLQQDEKKNWAIELGASVELEEVSEAESGGTAAATASVSAKTSGQSSGKNSGNTSANASPLTPQRSSPIATDSADSLLQLPASDNPSTAQDVPAISSAFSTTSSRSMSPANSGAKFRLGNTSMGQAIPSSVFQYVLSSVETVVLSAPTDLGPYSAFGQDPYFRDPSHRPQAILCMPVLKAGEVYGVVSQRPAR